MVRGSSSAALVLVILLAPIATAAKPFEARLDLDGLPAVEGALALDVHAGALDLAEGSEGFQLHWTRATGDLVERSWTKWTTPLGNDVATSPDLRRTPVEWGAGSLRALRCGAESECVMLLIATGDGSGTLEGRGDVAGALREAGSEHRYWAVADDGTTPDAFVHRVPTHALDARDLAPGAHGRLVLFLREATGALEGGDRDVLDVRSEVEPIAPGIVRAVTRHAVLVLEGVKLETPPDARALLWAEDWSMHLEGVLRAESATGSVREGATARIVHSDPVAFTGSFVLAREAEAWTVQGESTDVRIGGAPFASGPDSATVAITGAAILALALALLPLYSRITRADVLGNENRRRLYEEVRARPGPSLSTLARRVGLARVVALHHLRILEMHHFIVRRADGAGHAYFVTELAPADARMEAWLALRSPTRRLIAERIEASAAPLTQRDIEAATGISQRLVSHHMQALVQAGLVEIEAGKPKRHFATSELSGALRGDLSRNGQT